MTEQPRAPEPISPEISRITSTIDSIINADFSKLEEKDIILQVQKTGEIKKGDANFMMTDEKGQNTPLTQYLDQNLHTLAATLPETEQQELITQGILKKEGERLVFTDKVKSEDRLNFISALFKHYKEDGFDKLSVQLEANGLNVGDTLTTLQILSLDYAEKALGEYGKTQGIEETKTGRKTILKKNARGRLQISGAFSPDEKGLELSLMRGSLFRVGRKSTTINNEGKEVSFGKLELELARAAKAGNYDRFSEIPGRFLDLSQNDAKAKNAITERLRITIQRKISDQESNLSQEDKINLQALLPTLTNPANFEEALKTVFSFDAWQVGTRDADPAKRNESFRNLYSGFYEWGLVMFGREGYGRLQEVDLKMAVGIQDTLLPPDVRQKRILLEERVRQIKQGILGDQTNPDLNHVLSKLVSIDDEYKDAVHDLLEEKQKEQKAILHAFGVRYEDGTPAVAETDLDNPTKQLAIQIKDQFTTIRGKSVLGANRDATLAILTNLGVNLTSDQQDQLREHLSADSLLNPDKTSGLISSDQILAEMGIYKTAPNYQNIKAVIKDGRRVASSLVSLGKKETDDVYSKAESLKMGGGTLFDMGLKGVEYLYRQGVEEKTGAEETVIVRHEVKTPPHVTLPDSVTTYKIDESGDLLLNELLQGSKKPIPPEPPKPPAAPVDTSPPAAPQPVAVEPPTAVPPHEPAEPAQAEATIDIPPEIIKCGEDIVALYQITQGIKQMRDDLARQLEDPGLVPPVIPGQEDAISAEQSRRSGQVQRLDARLNYINILLNTVSNREQELRKNPAYQEKDIEREIKNTIEHTLNSYVDQIIMVETPVIWGHLQSVQNLETALSDEDKQKPEVQNWLRVRKNMWQKWEQTMKQNGFEFIIPEEGEKIDFEIHEVAVNESTTDEPIIKRVSVPGLRYRGNFFKPVKVVSGDVGEKQPAPLQPTDGPPIGEPGEPSLGTAEAVAAIPATDEAAIEQQILDATDGINTPLGKYLRAELDHQKKQAALIEYINRPEVRAQSQEERNTDQQYLALFQATRRAATESNKLQISADLEYADNPIQIREDFDKILDSLESIKNELNKPENIVDGKYIPEVAAKIEAINNISDTLGRYGGVLVERVIPQPSIAPVATPQPPSAALPADDGKPAAPPLGTPAVVFQPSTDQTQVKQGGKLSGVMDRLGRAIHRERPPTQTAEAGIQTPTEQQRKLERLLKNGVKNEVDLNLILLQRMAELGITDLTNNNHLVIDYCSPIKLFLQDKSLPKPTALKVMGDVLLCWPQVTQTQSQIPDNLKERAVKVHDYLRSQGVLAEDNQNLANLFTILFAGPQLPQEVKNRNQKIVEFVVKINTDGKYNPSDEVKDTVRSFLAALRTVDHSSTLVKGITLEKAETPQPLTALTADRTAEPGERPLSQEEIDAFLDKIAAEDNLKKNQALSKIKDFLDGLSIPDKDKRLQQIATNLPSVDLEAIAETLTNGEEMLPDNLAQSGTTTPEEIQTAKRNLNTTRLFISAYFPPSVQNRDIIAKYLYPMMKNANYDFASFLSESVVLTPNFGYWITMAEALRDLLI